MGKIISNNKETVFLEKHYQAESTGIFKRGGF